MIKKIIKKNYNTKNIKQNSIQIQKSYEKQKNDEIQKKRKNQ